MYEARFRVEDHGPYAAVTRDSDARIELWCNDHCDLLHVAESDDNALDRVASSVGVRDELSLGDDRVVITDDCLQRHEETVEWYLERHDCLLLPPLAYENGAKHCRVLALDPANLTGVYRDLSADHEVAVAEKHELATPAREAPVLSLDGILPSLTARQRDVLRTAHRNGYYEIPRETTTAELAERFDLDRRTVEEHLRRAENKILGALVDHGVV
ncbi:helix-turn-helix domain-containing protein [Halobacterium noricense]|uniref:helix-turn-helix domain-containing protein n=1 Tax=Halobacterium noricense TaxID=223182 RepID=UPI001E37EF93|nr:helix-turn-helix domain-containing protein [Halobacterium noricense]UHH27152.1 helix-turn-helix domain-containing protein [Halobacterium noricense]